MIACPGCDSDRIERFPVIHHMLCAYVGPLYDFGATGEAYTCPKCRLKLEDRADDSEIIGYSYRFQTCGLERPEGIAT